MAVMARPSRLASLLALSFAVSTIGGLVPAAPAAEAASKSSSSTSNAQNGQVNAEYMVGFAENFGGNTEYQLYIQNPLARDYDMDVMIFVYNREQQPQDCGIVHLLRNATSVVSVIPDAGEFGAIALVALRQDDTFITGPKKGDNERKGIIAYLRPTDGDASAATQGFAQMVPLTLTGKMRDNLRLDFDPDSGPLQTDCAQNDLTSKPAKKGSRSKGPSLKMGQ
ncbi:MAG: hypothetical protein IT307_00240 [Chloroflexi bacterium]|nr:hypothetical protein [Chloroflexota bacterium]